MDSNRFQIISEALYSYGASDFKEQLLETITLDELLWLSLSLQDQRTSFRAAWAMEHILLANKTLLLQYSKQVLHTYANANNWSVLRSVSKLVMALAKELKDNNGIFSEEEDESLINKTFEILGNLECPIAVRCNAYDILLALVGSQEWVAHELRLQIQFDLERNSTPALTSRGLRVLKKLERIPRS